MLFATEAECKSVGSMLGMAHEAERPAPPESQDYIGALSGALLRPDPGRKVANENLVVGKLTCLPPTVVPPVAGFDPLALPLIPIPKLEIDLPVAAYV